MLTSSRLRGRRTCICEMLEEDMRRDRHRVADLLGNLSRGQIAQQTMENLLQNQSVL
jgi:hypothetical protein